MSNILIDVLGETCYHIHFLYKMLEQRLYTLLRWAFSFCLITMFLKDVRVEFKSQSVCFLLSYLTLTVLVTTVDALGHFETG